MPIFEYVCKECQHQFEALVYGKEKAACPKCESKKLRAKALRVRGVGEGRRGSGRCRRALRIVRQSRRAGLLRVEELGFEFAPGWRVFANLVSADAPLQVPTGNHLEITNAIFPALRVRPMIPLDYNKAWTGAKSRGSGLNFRCASGGLTGWHARSRRSCG